MTGTILCDDINQSNTTPEHTSLENNNDNDSIATIDDTIDLSEYINIYVPDPNSNSSSHHHTTSFHTEGTTAPTIYYSKTGYKQNEVSVTTTNLQLSQIYLNNKLYFRVAITKGGKLSTTIIFYVGSTKNTKILDVESNCDQDTQYQQFLFTCPASTCTFQVQSTLTDIAYSCAKGTAAYNSYLCSTNAFYCGSYGRCTGIAGAPCDCMLDYSGDKCEKAPPTTNTPGNVVPPPSGSTSDSSSSNSPAAIAGGLGAAGVVIVVIIICFYARHLRKEKAKKLEAQKTTNRV